MRLADLFSRTESKGTDEVRDLLAGKGEEVTLIDVREPHEYERGHIPGAILMPMSTLPGRVSEIDPERTAITY